MKQYIILFCLLLSYVVKAQNITIKSVIVNDADEPIPFSTVSIKGKDMGVVTDKNGVFEINTHTNDTLIISSVGYITVMISASALKSKIKLKPQITTLDDVIIRAIDYKKFNQTERLGILESPNGLLKTGAGYSLVIKITSDDFKEGLLKSISAKFDRKNVKSASLRIRVYSINSKTGKPEYDLLTENVIVDVKKKNLDFDMEKYKIITPADGFFIGFDWLDISKNLGPSKSSFAAALQQQYPTLKLVDIYEPFIRTTNKDCRQIAYSKSFDGEWRVWKPILSKCPNNPVISVQMKYKE